ncbi:MAG: DUF2017 family protein [Acidimicrobiales bacterium]
MPHQPRSPDEGDERPDDEGVELVPLRLFTVEGERVTVSLPAVARENLHLLADAVRSALLGEGADEERDLQRLFPPAYEDDERRDEEYQRLMRDELLAARLGALDVFEAGLDRGELDRAGFDRWLQALNTIRVWLGTRLGVDDDDWEPHPDDDRIAEIGAYTTVGVLLEVALATLDEPSS